MSIYMLKMSYEKEFADYLQGHMHDPQSAFNRLMNQQGGMLLSLYQTQAGQDLIFLLEGPEDCAREIQQSVIRKAPTLFKEMRVFN